MAGKHISRQVKSTGLSGHSQELWVTRRPGRPVPEGKPSAWWAGHQGCSPGAPGDNKDFRKDSGLKGALVPCWRLKKGKQRPFSFGDQCESQKIPLFPFEISGLLLRAFSSPRQQASLCSVCASCPCVAPKVRGGIGATGEHQLTQVSSQLSVATKRGTIITPFSCEKAVVGLGGWVEVRWEKTGENGFSMLFSLRRVPERF